MNKATRNRATSKNTLNAHSQLNEHTAKKKTLALVLAGLLTSFITIDAVAQELSIPCDEAEEKALAEAKGDEVERISAFTPATPLKRVDPRYPTLAVRKGREGWVRLSYVIDEEGRVKDPVVEDFFGSPSFKRSALSAVKKWQYNPAIKDGEPTQQCHQAVQMDFSISGKTGATRKFIKAYKNVDEMFKAGDVEAADEALKELLSWDSLNRYENAWLLSLESQIASTQNDIDREARSLTRLLASNGQKRFNNAVFDGDYVAYALQRKILLDAQRGYYAEALKSYSKLQEMEEQQARVDEIAAIIKKVETSIASENNLKVPVSIGDNGRWFHTLVRNKFAFNNIQGELDTVEVRCDSHREKFTVAEAHVWHIPQSWGQCQVMVKGDSETKFDLVEVAKG
ncbi:energy transducer TonB [Alteromonas sp. ALT199]|uniref:energy transducer TonB n=1 Tax=unclassified Alteromonas TaxID=2614992 RepID=UPI001BEA76BB|nr:energy transducer TonB [Alteromonas sp. ALT199]MBT3137259.1 energy transducer TonB [Alteromonas sp. ALT199]